MSSLTKGSTTYKLANRVLGRPVGLALHLTELLRIFIPNRMKIKLCAYRERTQNFSLGMGGGGLTLGQCEIYF
jgi:hypothetical protein